MARLQYKVCMSPEPPGEHSYGVHVYVRRVLDDGTEEAWHHVVGKRVWLDDMAYSHGRALKRLARSLA